ncbi:MAG: T9SS type A sorting domain-containing protein [Chitinophagaceae bacterium]|jgi:hypothetical protein|nr:T9SS type A sorting domain-containing protein [Chitinophagaceae bacterium]
MKKIPLIKNIVLLLFAFSVIKAKTSAQLTVTENTHLVTSGAGIQIVLQSLGLVNDGTFNQTAGNVQITGDGVYAIAGRGPLSFYNLEMNKSANYIILSRNIAVKNQLKFTAGILRLNNYEIDLLSTGILINETEASRISSVNTGKVKRTAILNAPNAANPGNLGAVFTSTENFGSVSIERGHQSQINDQGTGNSILRYYEITPSNNAQLKATLRFNYFDAELNGIAENSLVLFKGSANGSWDEKGYTTRDATINYVEKINNPDFSRWTLSNTGNVLASGCPEGEALTYYADADGDGYGNPNSTIKSCVPQPGFITNKTDCNDANAAIHPGAVEVCDGVDNNCDGQVDEGVKITYYADADGDGYGSNISTIQACSMPQGYLASGGDCNDNNTSINPGVTEVCGNGLDDNCNGQNDEGCNTNTPSLTIDNQTVYEFTGMVQLTVTLSAPASSTVSVKYKTINGTAVHPKDYLRLSSELIFAPGETTKTINVEIKSDNTPELTEYFDVQLNTPQNATIANSTGRVTIIEGVISMAKNQTITEAGNVFEVRVSPNPTSDYFMLDVRTNNKEQLQIKITDVNGRLIESIRKPMSNRVLLGNTFRAGVYFAEVTQGEHRKIIKLIKL